MVNLTLHNPVDLEPHQVAPEARESTSCATFPPQINSTESPTDTVSTSGAKKLSPTVTLLVVTWFDVTLSHAALAATINATAMLAKSRTEAS